MPHAVIFRLELSSCSNGRA